MCLIVMSVGRYECNKIDAEENLPTLCHGIKIYINGDSVCPSVGQPGHRI